MEKWLTYDKISLIPTLNSTLEHRSEADTSVQFGQVKLSLPLISAPMPDISGPKMTSELAKTGSFGWIHRFGKSVADQYSEIEVLTHHYGTGSLLYGVAVSPRDIDTAVAVHKGFGINVICLDTANGASAMVERAIKRLKDLCPDIFIVAGNVASSRAFWLLQEWGADAIRVGIGTGSVCQTKDETGIYSPMATLISSISGVNIDNDYPTIVQSYPMQGYFGLGYGQQYSFPLQWNQTVQVMRPQKTALLVADGGIKAPADMCKAIALGADLVMAGGVFAGTDEAPGETDAEGYKAYSGAASYDIQKKSGRDEIVYVEGKTTIVPPKGPVANVIARYAAGLRSSMSYMNARDLTEYRTNVKIVEIS